MRHRKARETLLILLDAFARRYDPVSAHFVLTRRVDGVVVATVRLTPYPRKTHDGSSSSSAADAGAGNVSQADTATSRQSSANTLGQDETSMVQSAGGPQGSSAGLPMFSSRAPESKTQGTPAATASDSAAREALPLGRPVPHAALVESFHKRIAAPKESAFREGQDAPVLRGAKLSRLAVSRSERGKGCGALVVRQVEIWLLRVIGSVATTTPPPPDEMIGIVISSQMPVVPFYEALGYKKVGEPYDEEGAPHSWCVKQLAEVQK